LLRPRRFRSYSLNKSFIGASIDLAIPLCLFSCTIQTPLTSRVKIEYGMESIILSVMTQTCAYLRRPCPQELPHGMVCLLMLLMSPSHAPTKNFPHPGLKQQSSVVKCLKKLCASKGSKNALKRLDYDIVKLLRVDYLPLIFNVVT
jgi:hypothetical protein